MVQSVVLAEDNLEHCFFFKKALKEVSPETNFTEIHDGDSLMELLDRYLPDLLFLDLGMPCKNGIDCIKEIRQQRIYDSMPVVVFSMNSFDHSIQTAYGLGANLYIVKPADFSLLKRTLQSVLSMNWNDPQAITEKYFQKNKYIPFI
jgi:DNA-binding NarL/FixJ family response regulator